MAHLYAEYEGTPLWVHADAALGDLERNGDVALTTTRTHAVGYLCQALVRGGVPVGSAAGPSSLVLSSDEALVLFDILARGAELGALVVEHPAEDNVLRRFQQAMGRHFWDPRGDDYRADLAAAHRRLASAVSGRPSP